MNKKTQAQQLYMQGATQKEIAATIGVSDRTIWTWVHQYSWDKLRLAAYQAPAIISDNLCSQIVELQNAIAARPIGSRYPTMQEAEIMRKLIVMLEKMKKTPSLSQNMQMLETFRNYVRPIDLEFSKKLAGYAERFLEGKSINGYAPYEPGYGVEPVPPIMPFFPETEEEEAEEKIHSAAERIIRYHIPPIHYQKQQELAEEKSQPATSESPTLHEESSQSPEAPNQQTSQQTPTPPTQRKGLRWQKKNRSFSTPQIATAPLIGTAHPDTHTGNEPEAFSQLAPTG